MVTRPARQRGFTLPEVMAVVAIIVIVVFTVIIAPWESPVQAVGGAWR